MLEKLETCLKKNNGGDGWFVGDDVNINFAYCIIFISLHFLSLSGIQSILIFY